MPAELSGNLKRADDTLRAALDALGLRQTTRTLFREWVKSGAWARAVGVVCDQIDSAEQRGAERCTTTTPGR